MEISKEEKMISILNHLYWFKDKINFIEDNESYSDFINSIRSLEALIKEEE